MFRTPKTHAASVAFVAATLLQIFAANADLRLPPKPLKTRVQQAEKVFVGVLVKRDFVGGDWCHAALKVTQAIKGCKVDDLVPVVWRPKLARYDAVIGQTGLSVLKGKYKDRYWISLSDVKQAEDAIKFVKEAEFQTEYVKGAALSEELEKTVMELALRCGIKKVAKISSYNLYPSEARGIAVQGADQVKGREVSYKILHVRYKDWWHAGETPTAGDLQFGDFWAGKPTIQKHTILKVGKAEYRTRAIRDLSIEECESILGKFISGKYTCGADVKEETLQQIDFTKPQGFRKRGDGISVSFNHKRGGGGFFELEVTPTKDQLMINQLVQAMP